MLTNCTDTKFNKNIDSDFLESECEKQLHFKATCSDYNEHENQSCIVFKSLIENSVSES